MSPQCHKEAWVGKAKASLGKASPKGQGWPCGAPEDQGLFSSDRMGMGMGVKSAGRVCA